MHENFTACRRAINEAQNENREVSLWAALDTCVIGDIRVYEMIGDLRLLGNVLAKFFKR